MKNQEHNSKQFPAQEWQKLLDEKRNDSLDIEVFFNYANPHGDEVWLDFGAGPGYFTLPLASKTQKVIAADISEQMLEICKKRARESNLTNIDFVKIVNSEILLPSHSVDKILLSNVVHELDDPQADLKEIKRLLKASGAVFVIDWKPMEMEMGPPLHHRLSQDEVKNMFKQAGFRFVQEWDVFEYHYFCLFKK